MEEAKAHACLYMNNSSWHDGACERFPFLSFPHLRPHTMSRTHIFSNAHGTAVSGGTFYAANAVSETVRYVLSRLMAWFSGRSISTTAIGRRPTGSFPLCRIQAIGSPDVQKSLPDLRDIFPTQMTQLRRESPSCCMEWEGLEKLRFA